MRYLAIMLFATNALLVLGACSATESSLFAPGAVAALHARPGPGERRNIHPTTCSTADPVFVETTGTHIRTFRCGTKINDIYGSNTQISEINSLATDPTTGDIYAAQGTSSHLQTLVFGPSQNGNVAPVSSWKVSAPGGFATIANDSNGNVWGGSSFLSEDAPLLFRVDQGDSGTVTPEQIVESNIGSGESMTGWTSLAVGSLDAVWGVGDAASGTVDYGMEIQKFPSTANGYTAPSKRWHGSNVNSILAPLDAFIAVGNNQVYVATVSTNSSYSIPPTIWVWNANDANGNTAPDHFIRGSNTGLVEPAQMQIDTSGNIWVADYGASAVLEFAGTNYGNVAPIATYSLSYAPLGLTLCYAEIETGTECTTGQGARRHEHLPLKR